MERLYFNPAKASSYSSVDSFYEEILKEGEYKPTKSFVRRWLQKYDAYTLHRPLKRTFKRNRVVVNNIDHLWEADLIVFDKSRYKGVNGDYGFILVVIDVFSRFVWTVPLKTRKCRESTEALRSILGSTGRHPRLMRTDAGGEFIGNEMKTFLRQQDIVHIITRNEVKANYVERVIQTIKTRLFRYFTHKNTYRWVDVISDLTDSYNRSYHTTIRRAPITVHDGTRDEVWATQYIVPVLESVEKKKSTKTASRPKKRRRGVFKYKAGDHVRISHKRKPFERAYDEKFTGEIFKVEKRFRREDIPIYKLVDWGDDPIEGTFYQQELEKVHVDDNTIFKIDKILKKRKRRGVRESLVRWLYYPAKFDSWLSDREIRELMQ